MSSEIIDQFDDNTFTKDLHLYKDLWNMEKPHFVHIFNKNHCQSDGGATWIPSCLTSRFGGLYSLYEWHLFRYAQILHLFDQK